MRYCIGSMCAMPLSLLVALVRHRIACVALMVGSAAFVGCGEPATSGVAPKAGGPARIASLSPAITECVSELGLADRIVGRTPWCEAAETDVPVVGTLLDVDAEALVRCAPTMVLVQPPAQGIDPALTVLAATRGWAIHSWRINGLDDARAAMEGLANAVAEAEPARADSVRTRYAEWCARLDASLAPLPALPEGGGVGPVLVMVGGIEGMAFGQGTYIDDALDRMGVENALERTGYPALSAEDVVRIRPRTIIVIGAADKGVLPESASVVARVVRVPAQGLSVPGGRLPHGLQALREALVAAGGPSGE